MCPQRSRRTGPSCGSLRDEGAPGRVFGQHQGAVLGGDRGDGALHGGHQERRHGLRVRGRGATVRVASCRAAGGRCAPGRPLAPRAPGSDRPGPAPPARGRPRGHEAVTHVGEGGEAGHLGAAAGQRHRRAGAPGGDPLGCAHQRLHRPVTRPVSPAPTRTAAAVARTRTPNARAVAARAFARAIASGALHHHPTPARGRGRSRRGGRHPRPVADGAGAPARSAATGASPERSAKGPGAPPGGGRAPAPHRPPARPPHRRPGGAGQEGIQAGRLDPPATTPLQPLPGRAPGRRGRTSAPGCTARW